jgi:hypothetical protein
MPNREQEPRAKIPDNSSKKIDTSGSSIPHWSEKTNGLAKKELQQEKTDKYPAKKLAEIAAKKKQLELEKKTGFVTVLAETPAVKEEGLRFLEKHDLPRYRKITVSLQEFLNSSQSIFKKLVSETELYYSSIVNLETGERIFRLGQRPGEVKEFILEKLASEEISPNSKLTLSEYWHNYYGGNLLIDPTGGIFIELVEGKHAKLVKSEGQVLMSAQTESYTRILQFSNNQEIDEELQTKLRQTLLRTIDLIPKKRVPLSEKVSSRFQESNVDEEGQEYIELPEPGYFEFILTKENEEAEELRTIFIDARTGSAADKYQLSQ